MSLLPVLARMDMPTGERKFGVGRCERKWRERIDALPLRLDRYRGIVIGAARYMLEGLRTALARMHAIEIERERVDELQLFVILKELFLVEPVGKLRVLADLLLQSLLAREFVIQHAFRQRPLGLGKLLDQHMIGEPVTAVIEAPAMHAGNQPAERALPLVEVGR